MRLLLATLVLIPFLARASAVAADTAKLAGDLAALQGEWVVDHAENSLGEVLAGYKGSMRHTVAGSKILFSSGGRQFEHKMLLDETSSPKRQMIAGKGGRMGLAIYRLEGDALKVIALGGPDPDWPAEFVPGPFDVVLVYRRIQP